MKKLFDLEAVVSPLKDENITHKWVVIKPQFMTEQWKEEYQEKDFQVVRAHGGFGCKDGSLSWSGGKVFAVDKNGIDTVVYRNHVLGIATESTLEELGIHE